MVSGQTMERKEGKTEEALTEQREPLKFYHADQESHRILPKNSEVL